jgi:hypothetical protein
MIQFFTATQIYNVPKYDLWFYLLKELLHLTFVFNFNQNLISLFCVFQMNEKNLNIYLKQFQRLILHASLLNPGELFYMPPCRIRPRVLSNLVTYNIPRSPPPDDNSLPGSFHMADTPIS